MSNRVFLVQEPLRRDVDGNIISRINPKSFADYGVPVIVFPWSMMEKIGVQPSHEDTDALLWHAREVLKDFDDEDYLIPIGNPALIAIASIVASECNSGFVSLLDWMKKERAYRLFEIDSDAQPIHPAGTSA